MTIKANIKNKLTFYFWSWTHHFACDWNFLWVNSVFCLYLRNIRAIQLFKAVLKWFVLIVDVVCCNIKLNQQPTTEGKLSILKTGKYRYKLSTINKKCDVINKYMTQQTCLTVFSIHHQNTAVLITLRKLWKQNQITCFHLWAHYVSRNILTISHATVFFFTGLSLKTWKSISNIFNP